MKTLLSAAAVVAFFVTIATASDQSDCLNDPSQPKCSTYQYPAANASADLEMLCGPLPGSGGSSFLSMSWMPGCTLRRVCQQNPALQQHNRYCSQMSLLGDICQLDMPMMRSCKTYSKICDATVTKIAQCAQQAPLKSSPKTGEIMQLVKDMCTDHAMEACSRCDFNQGKPACEDPLQVYADLCLSMPEMTQCSRWNEMCADLSVDGEFPLCPSSNNAEQPPLMRMYFHTGWKDYVLFKEWVPRTAEQFWLSCLAVFFLAFFYEFLITLRAIMEFKWSSALRKSIYAAAEDDDTKEPGTPADDDNASIHSRTGMLSRRRSPVQPFRVWVEPVRGLMSMLEITISYGLMLIAMTFNVGLFFSVVLGVGVGTFVFARYRPLPLRSACCQ